MTDTTNSREGVLGAPVPLEDVQAAPSGMTALLVGSSGGHLDHLLRLEPWWRDMDRAWVTFDLPDARSRLAEERSYWAYYPTTRNLKNFVRNLFLARKVLRAERPDVVVSTGAGLAVPFFILARVYGSTTVFLEVFDRVTTRTMTGRLCKPLSSIFLVQWHEQERLYPGSVYIGSIYA